ncbi:hypothetical protein D3C80_1297280 [compost metagenome]
MDGHALGQKFVLTNLPRVIRSPEGSCGSVQLRQKGKVSGQIGLNRHLVHMREVGEGDKRIFVPTVDQSFTIGIEKDGQPVPRCTLLRSPSDKGLYTLAVFGQCCCAVSGFAERAVGAVIIAGGEGPPVVENGIHGKINPSMRSRMSPEMNQSPIESE